MDMFNEPGNCLLLAMLTDYGKADIQMLNDENLKCHLVESMYDPREGIIYQAGEEFTLMVNAPVVCEYCEYDHGWAVVRMYGGYCEGRTPVVKYVIATMTYAMEDNGLIPI